MGKLNVVILAAGKGERMVSKRPKVMHEIAGTPMAGFVIERARALSPSRIVVVTGYGREQVQEYLKGFKVKFSVQEEQKGTAHALLTTGKYIKGGDVLVLYGDVPMIRDATLEQFLDFFGKTKALTFMVTDVERPAGYGRVVMKGDDIDKIVEDADATKRQKAIKTINTGICIIPERYWPLLKEITNDNKKGEYYLTDICTVAKEKGLPVKGFRYSESSEVLGINSRKELLEANTVMKDRIINEHMANGVTFTGANVYVEHGVTIGQDTIIRPNCFLAGKTAIGKNVAVGSNVIIRDSVIGDDVNIADFVLIEDANVKKGARIPAFSYLNGDAVQKGRVHGTLSHEGE